MSRSDRERAEGSRRTPSSAVGTVVPAGALAGGPAALLRIRSGVPDGLYRPTEVDIGIGLVTVGRAAVCVVDFLDREAGFLGNGDRLGGREPLGPGVAGSQRRTPDRERRGDEGSVPDGRRGAVVVGGRESRRRPGDGDASYGRL